MTIEAIETTDEPVVEPGHDAAPDAGNPGGPEVDNSSPQSAESAAPEASAPNYWDYFRSNVPQFSGMDDRAIAGQLWQSMHRERAAQQALAEYQRILPIAREYQQHRPQFEEWRRTQVAAQQQKPEPPPAPKLWDPPKLREAYKQYLVKDESGRETIHPEAPLDAKHELYEYQQYKANFAKNLLEDPEKTLSPFIEKVANDRAQAIVEKQFGDIALKGYVANLEHEHRDWLRDRSTGNATPEGVAVNNYITQMSGWGISDPEVAWELATSLVERDMQRQVLNYLLSPQQQGVAPAPAPAAPFSPPVASPPQAPPQQTRDQQNMEFLRREASRNPSPSPKGDLSSQGRPTGRKLTGEDLFRQLLAEQAEADGLLV